MASQNNGYVKVPVDSYDAFRLATLDSGYNVDYEVAGGYGDQCWDFAAIFYYSAFNVTGYPATGNGYAYGCWVLKKDHNTLEGLTQITNIEDVKRGDLVVLNQGRFSYDNTGHIAFADEDYNGTIRMGLLGQNQLTAVNPYKDPNTGLPIQGYPVTTTVMLVSTFLGAWRYDKWNKQEPVAQKKKHRYPWAVFGTQVRDKMIY